MMNNEFYHYGVPGMRWGVRRNQKQLSRIERKSKKEGWNDDATSAAKIKTKKVSQMSNKELRDLNNRMNLEQQHKDLSVRSSKGRSAVKGFIATAGTLAAVSSAVAIYAKHGKKAYNSIGKVKQLSKVAIDARKSGVAVKTIAKAAKEAFKANYLK